jgi:hypothetical protein
MLLYVVFDFDEDTMYPLDFDEIEVPDKVVNCLQKIEKQFKEWLYDKTNEHGYWIMKNGEKYAVSYGTEEFVKWLNENQRQPSRIIRKKLTNPVEGIACIYF